MSCQPKAPPVYVPAPYDPTAELVAFTAHLRKLEKQRVEVSRGDWWKLAREFFRLKRKLQRELIAECLPPVPPTGGSAVMRPYIRPPMPRVSPPMPDPHPRGRAMRVAPEQNPLQQVRALNNAIKAVRHIKLSNGEVRTVIDYVDEPKIENTTFADRDYTAQEIERIKFLQCVRCGADGGDNPTYDEDGYLCRSCERHWRQ